MFIRLATDGKPNFERRGTGQCPVEAIRGGRGITQPAQGAAKRREAEPRKDGDTRQRRLDPAGSKGLLHAGFRDTTVLREFPKIVPHIGHYFRHSMGLNVLATESKVNYFK